MSASRMAAGLVAGFEGFSAAPYRCPAGRWTIGYGTTMLAPKQPVTAATPPVTKEQALALLERDLQSAFRVLDLYVKVPLTDCQRAALASFVYNVGEGAFYGSTMLKRLNARDYAGAANWFPKWNIGGGRVLPGLVRRRATERAMFLAEA